jgi:hypothetical protein
MQIAKTLDHLRQLWHPYYCISSQSPSPCACIWDRGESFGVFPVKTSIIIPPGPHKHFNLGPGSIWFRAPWFATGAPLDSFTGFRIQSGSLDFSGAGPIVSGVVVIPAGSTFKLSAQLAPNPAPTFANGPGADVNHATVQTPVNIQIDFAENAATLVSLDDSSLISYGTTVNFHWNHAHPAFASGQIAIPCDPDVATFSFSNVRSTLFLPSGSATIAAGGWALPAPETTIANLGEADGAGFLYLGLGSGISAQWKTHDVPAAFDGVILEASPGKLSIIASSSTAKSSFSLLELWDEKPASLNRKSTIEFIYPKPTSIVYLATASTELLYSTGTLNAIPTARLRPMAASLPQDEQHFLMKQRRPGVSLTSPTTKLPIYTKELRPRQERPLEVQPPAPCRG